ncbi:MAG TPA: nitroreductase/quinone reductase family protein [Actinomycetota bacterium]|nr:nitroreductase/quinone reductase family protein [Actinomycetota bacterium]
MTRTRERRTPYHRLGLWLTRRLPGVYVLRYLWTPLDRLALRLTGGRRGLAPKAIPELLLTTTGRRSGERRSTPVLFLEHGEGYAVVASNYGRRRHPGWSYNLQADPRASVQIGTLRREMEARPATPEEFERLWPRFVEMWPGWKTYRRMTDRPFRMFVLEPRGPQRG